jgi:glycosyltransferase involved in cell wall biosynthesis
VSVARLFPARKGHFELLRALALAKRKYPNVRLAVVGTDYAADSGATQMFKEHARDLGVGENVVVAGQRSARARQRTTTSPVLASMRIAGFPERACCQYFAQVSAGRDLHRAILKVVSIGTTFTMRKGVPYENARIARQGAGHRASNPPNWGHRKYPSATNLALWYQDTRAGIFALRAHSLTYAGLLAAA